MTDCDIVQADALDVMLGLAPESVSCVVTDPPYGIAYHSNHYAKKNPHAPIANDWNFNLREFLYVTSMALRPGGAVYVFTRWDVLPLWSQEIPDTLSLKNVIVWVKDNWSSGDLTGNFGFQYEVIMFMVKGRHQLRGHRHPNVWNAARVPAKRLRMPAEKPVSLYERAITASSDPGDLVVDPFCGSGTMAEAALRTQRRFLCADVDPKMVDMARSRAGLPPLEPSTAPKSLGPCPVWSVTPPDPHLWGLHPEDLLHGRDVPVNTDDIL